MARSLQTMASDAVRARSEHVLALLKGIVIAKMWSEMHVFGRPDTGDPFLHCNRRTKALLLQH